MICQLKFDEIKDQKAKFFINKINLPDLNNKLFSIIMLQLILLFLAIRYACFYLTL